jgi:hypothetical protein
VATLKEQMAADLDVFYNTDEFAVDAEYTPKATGVAVQVTAIVDEGEIDNYHGRQSDGLEHVLTCERDVRSGFNHRSISNSSITRAVITVRVRAADVPAPDVSDEINIDGAVYRVVEMFDDA